MRSARWRADMRRLRDSALCLLLVGLLLSAGARTAAGYKVLEAPDADATSCGFAEVECGAEAIFLRWFELDVPFWVNSSAADDAGSAGFSQADAIGAAQAAYQAWEDVPAATIRFTYVGETDLRLDPAGHDEGGANTTLWYDPDLDSECSELIGLGGTGHDGWVALGLTILTVDAESGQIIDADVVLNSAVDWVWEDACDSYDPQGILTHEYGHTIGIGHSGEAGPDGMLATADDPTMNFGRYFDFCSGDLSVLRSLEPDDEAAAECLYPELPAVILIDQTGSMGSGSRMADAIEAASSFVDDFAGTNMAVAAFADASAAACGVARPGYELKQDWTDDTTLLKDAITPLTACGQTPLWESICCAITKAEEEGPSNLLIFTDTAENASDGDCGCTTFADVLAAAGDASVTIYVIDMTVYFGSHPGLASSVLGDAGVARVASDSDDLQTLAAATGGLYRAVDNNAQLVAARGDIRRNMARVGKFQQLPPTCHPGPFPLDIVQRYVPGCAGPASPFAGQQVTVFGRVSVRKGTFDQATQYIEDCSGGIQVFGPGLPMANVGDTVQVTGTVDISTGEIRIANVVSYALIGPPNPDFAHLGLKEPTNCQEVNCCEMIGSLQRFQGFAAGPVVDFQFPLVRFFGLPNAYSTMVRLVPSTGIDPGVIHPGGFYVVTGVMTRGPSGIELKPRGPVDLQKIIPVGVAPPDPLHATPRTMIRSAYPNPFGQSVSIEYAVPRSGRVRVLVLDVQGKRVRRVFDGPTAGTTFTARWDGRDDRGRLLRSGVYFVEVLGPDGVRDARRLLFMR
jgi:VWA domain-containing protein